MGWNGPIGFDSVLFHNFYALDALSGEKLWNYTIGYTIVNPPAVFDNTIYIGGSLVTHKAPDAQDPGAVIALKSTVTQLPSPSPLQTPQSTPSNSPVSTPLSYEILILIAIGAVAILAGLISAFILFRKKIKIHS